MKIKTLEEFKEFVNGEGLVSLDQALRPHYEELDRKYNYPRLTTHEEIDSYFDEKRTILHTTAADVAKQNAAWMARKEKLFWRLLIKTYIVVVLILITSGMASYYAN